MSKKFVTSILAVVIVLSLGLTGCGTDTGTDDHTKPAGGTAESTVLEDVAGKNETENSESSVSETDDEPVLNVSKSGYDVVATLESYAEASSIGFSLTDSQKEFINSHLYLYPADENDFTELESCIDYGLDYAHMIKNPGKYSGSYAYLDGLQIVQVNESAGQNGEYSYVTKFNLQDQDGNAYYVYYIGESVDVVEDDYVRIAAMPIANSSYQNLSGNSVNTLVMLASYVEINYSDKLSGFIENAISERRNEGIAEQALSAHGISLDTIKEIVTTYRYFGDSEYTSTFDDYDFLFYFEDSVEEYYYKITEEGYALISWETEDDIDFMRHSLSDTTNETAILTEEEAYAMSDDDIIGLYGLYTNYDITMQDDPGNEDMDGDYGDFVLQYSDSRYYTEEELSNYTKEDLRIARNEIYARHGRIFSSEDLQQYFNSKNWYYGYLNSDEFNESVLNDYEKKNLVTIKTVEDRK